MKCIYFDNAATSWPKPESMIKAMADFNANVGANPGRSGHRLSIQAARIIYETRSRIAAIIGADDPMNVIFARNATEGINTITRGFLKPGDHVVTSSMEHNSVMRPLRAMEKDGLELGIVRCSAEGRLSPKDVADAIKKNTRMIIMTHASNVTGTVLPVADIARIAREHDVVFCIDAAQTTGSIPINVLKDDIDILVFTGHKSLYGPQGTGGFYVRKGLEKKISPLERGGTGSRSEYEEQPDFMPDRFESGTPNTIGIAGLGAGAAFVLERGVEAVHERENTLVRLFIDGISSVKRVKVYGDKDAAKRAAVVSFTIEGISSSDISYLLDERYSIMSRPGLHCAPSAHMTIGTFPEGSVRFSFGIFTTEEEIKTAIGAIESICSGK